MKVPFYLRKAAGESDVAGLLLLSADVRDLLAACAALGPPGGGAREGAALPPVYAVPGGFLIKVSRPPAGALPGTVRLRRLAGDLFLPADADLVPALLEDEAAALVRDRGLVFLPGGRALAFAPDRPLTASELLTCPRRPPRAWQPFPPRPARPDRLREVLLDLPNDTPDAILEGGAGAIGSEAPRPPAGIPGAQVVGGAALGVARGLLWLGRALGWGGLARAGANLARRAVERVPRLSEALLGKQEAALRELLRQFREGDLEKALRRALPLNSPSGRGAAVAGDDRLPLHSLLYSLRELLGGGRGPVGLWMGGGEVQAELAREYRKAAEEAAARGDWRRAAFIYGKLLHDFRLAAAVLERGGLHHDAAVIYMEKLGDTLGAARAFEAAGEVDRALQLYRRRGNHVAAGDLLRRAGEEDLALEEYRLAAALLAGGENHLAAGELLIERGRRPDLALEFFAAGWARRPLGSAQGCLLRLAEMRGAEESPRALLALAGEADEFFAAPGNDAGAAQFYNALARLAAGRHLAAVRDDLRDRALVGLASKLRQRAREESRPGNAVSMLLGQSGAWAPALVSDADFAFKASLRRPPVARSVPVNRVRLGAGQVTAVCAPPQGRAVFAGFASGEWAFFEPRAGRCFQGRAVDSPASAVAAMATDRLGSSVVILQAPTSEGEALTVHPAHAAVFVERARVMLPVAAAPAWLTKIVESEGHAVVGLWHGGRLATVTTPDLVPTGEIAVPSPAEELGAAVLLAPRSSGRPRAWMLFVGERLWHFAGDGDLQAMPVSLGWRPGAYRHDLLSPPPLSWQMAGGRLELAGVGGDEAAHWNEVQFQDGAATVARASTPQTGYVAAALLGPGRVAGVRRSGIDWLRRERGQLLPWTATGMDLAGAVACFPSPLTNELLVVCRDGWLVRVPVPH
jgi:hypothetical protein